VALVLVRLAGMQRRGSSRVRHLPAATKALCSPLLARVAADKLHRRRKLRSRSHQRLRWLLMVAVRRERRVVKMSLKMGMKRRTRYAAQTD
jgi:hypothetical protein